MVDSVGDLTVRSPEIFLSPFLNSAFTDLVVIGVALFLVFLPVLCEYGPYRAYKVDGKRGVGIFAEGHHLDRYARKHKARLGNLAHKLCGYILRKGIGVRN